jgi:hypothetical protein
LKSFRRRDGMRRVLANSSAYLDVALRRTSPTTGPLPY